MPSSSSPASPGSSSSVYAKNEAAVSEAQIGIVFFVNTIVIVLAQLPIARLAQGRRRMPTLALLGLLWAAAWVVVPIAGSETAGRPRPS